MKKFAFVTIAAGFALLSTSALAHDPIGPVCTTCVMFPDHSKVPAGAHDPNPTGAGTVVDTRAAMFPDHSKVIFNGTPYPGRGSTRDPSAGY
jgi:hypothetical protein